MSLDLAAAGHVRPRADATLATSSTTLSTQWLGRHLRPHRRRVRPLLGRRAVARPPLREDAVRPGAAGPRLPHAWQVFGEDRWRQVVEETVGYVLRDLRHPAEVSTRRRTPIRPTRTATVTRACSTRGRPTRSPSRSATTPALPSTGTGSPTAATSRAATILTGLPPRRARPAAEVERRAPGCSSPQARRAPGSTTRC